MTGTPAPSEDSKKKGSGHGEDGQACEQTGEKKQRRRRLKSIEWFHTYILGQK
jgi:hypothetical protein